MYRLLRRGRPAGRDEAAPAAPAGAPAEAALV